MFASMLAYRMAIAGHKKPVLGGPEVLRGDDILKGPYPKTWMEFVGQEQAKAQLLAARISAAKREARMDHVLLASGHPGIGKSSLARLLAHALNAGLVELGGNINDKAASKALRSLDDGDVLFLDEIHRLVSRGKSSAEWLLNLLQDGTMVTSTGVQRAPEITVIAATTDAQKLPQTILDRFPIKPVIVPYTDEEAVLVGVSAARRLGFGEIIPLPEGEWMSKVAKASDNNPRRMTQLLVGVRDVALSTNNSNLGEDGYDLTTALQWSGLTEDGLSTPAQNYLIFLYAVGGTAGITSIKSALQEEELKHTEALLIQKGYVLVTGRGRELTDFGAERALELARQQMEN